MMASKLYPHQEKAVSQLKTGSILCGGVGSGKSLTAIAYFYTKVCGGKLGEGPLKTPTDLFIITTAQKRDSLDWERECASFMFTKKEDLSFGGVKLVIDSWNNIAKYTKIENAFFIFDEQRVVGSGSWVKSFLKITKTNKWILLSATPGDTWIDYIPVFIANGFYKNRTEFIRNHVVYNNFTKFPKIDHYVEVGKLLKFRKEIIVFMPHKKPALSTSKTILASYDKEVFDLVSKKRWNPYENKPIKDISELCFTMRRVVNTHPNRLEIIKQLIEDHRKVIIFYNFNYELEILRSLKNDPNITVAEYNGHKHEPLPLEANSWVYLVQYTSGAEGWNCIETDTIIFYSQNYSFRTMFQASGRIDRLNTGFKVLYYYYIRSTSLIDVAIEKALQNKENFNEQIFAKG